MTAEQLRQHVMAVPFTPFYLRTTDGRRVPVVNRDFILITPTRSHVFVFQSDDSYQVLDVDLLVGAEFGPPAPTPPAPNLNA
jgi:hypothetical protein